MRDDPCPHQNQSDGEGWKRIKDAHYGDKNNVIREQKEQRRQLCLRHQGEIPYSDQQLFVQTIDSEFLQ